LEAHIPERPDEASVKPVLAVLDRYYADRFEIMCPQDIEEHFIYAPTPVFQLNGKSYAVRTRLAKTMVYSDQLQNGCLHQTR
jgi:hypothetical protein